MSCLRDVRYNQGTFYTVVSPVFAWGMCIRIPIRKVSTSEEDSSGHDTIIIGNLLRADGSEPGQPIQCAIIDRSFPTRAPSPSKVQFYYRLAGLTRSRSVANRTVVSGSHRTVTARAKS